MPWSGKRRTVSCSQDNSGAELSVMKGLTIFMLRICVVLLLSQPAAAQFTYTLDQSIPVEVDGRLLPNAWAGGLNSAQFNTLDLDGDGDKDLIVFERASGRILTFLNNNSTYEHNPDYVRLFPP